MTITDTDTQGTTTTVPASTPSQTPMPHGWNPLATKPSSGSRAASTADGKPPLASKAVRSSESKGGSEVEAAGEASKGSRHGGKSNTGREETGAVSEQARNSAEEEEGLPPSMTFKVTGFLFQLAIFLSPLGTLRYGSCAGFKNFCERGGRCRPCRTVAVCSGTVHFNSCVMEQIVTAYCRKVCLVTNSVLVGIMF